MPQKGDDSSLVRSGTLQRIQREASQAARAEVKKVSRPRTKLSKCEKDKAMAILARSYLKNWLSAHGQHLRPPKLHRSVMHVIEAWFDLVDEDGSGGLDSSELAAALKTAGLPCDEPAILEMLKLMDMNGDGEISWAEFEAFLTSEFANGKKLLSGEYVLPSGTALPFGAMVSKLKRNRIIADVLEGGQRRERWSTIAKDEGKLSAELSLLNRAEEEQQAFLKHAMLQRDAFSNRWQQKSLTHDNAEEAAKQITLTCGTLTRSSEAGPSLPTGDSQGDCIPIPSDTPTATDAHDPLQGSIPVHDSDPDARPDASISPHPGGVPDQWSLTEMMSGIDDRNQSFIPLPEFPNGGYNVSRSGTPDIQGYRAVLGAAANSAVKLLSAMNVSSASIKPSAAAAVSGMGPRDYSPEPGMMSSLSGVPVDKEAEKRQQGLAASILQHTISQKLHLGPSSCTSSIGRVSQMQLPQPSAYGAARISVVSINTSGQRDACNPACVSPHPASKTADMSKEAKLAAATAVIQQHDLVELFAQVAGADEELALEHQLMQGDTGLRSPEARELRKTHSQSLTDSPPRGVKKGRAEHGRAVSVCGLQDVKAMQCENSGGGGGGGGGVASFLRERGPLTGPVHTRNGLSIEQVIQSRSPRVSSVAIGPVRASFLSIEAAINSNKSLSFCGPSRSKSSTLSQQHQQQHQQPQPQGAVLPPVFKATNEVSTSGNRTFTRSTSCATLPSLNVQVPSNNGPGAVMALSSPDQQTSPQADARGSVLRGSTVKHKQHKMMGGTAAEQSHMLLIGTARG